MTIPGNLTVTGAINYLPKGIVVAWSGTDAPAGWSLCDGQKAKAIDGSDLQKPDLRGRFIFGWNPAGGKDVKVPGDDYNKINGIGGKQIHQLTVNEMPSHDHTMNENGQHQHNYCLPRGDKNWDNGGGNALWGGGCGLNPLTSAAGNHVHTINKTGGIESHNNMPPYYVLAYIIKL